MSTGGFLDVEHITGWLLPGARSCYETAEPCGPYLYFNAERTWLAIRSRPEFYRAGVSRRYLFCSLRDGQGNLVGVLRLGDATEEFSACIVPGLHKFLLAKDTRSSLSRDVNCKN